MGGERATQKGKWKAWLAGAWALFCVSLATWWMIFALKQLRVLESHLEVQGSQLREELLRQQRMIVSEGSILILCLFGGGIALLYYVNQERLHNLRTRAFFATFSHELKTSIASLRLQVESLFDDLGDVARGNPLFGRLLEDSVRVELQLENSLFLSQLDRTSFYLERISLKRLLDSISHQWPELAFEFAGEDAAVLADRRAIESVLKNLIQNARVHGKAKRITLRLSRGSGPGSAAGEVHVHLRDDGAGFEGEAAQIGKLFHRHNPRSGSGIGLYLVSQLMAQMGGAVEFPRSARKDGGGFEAILRLVAAPAEAEPSRARGGKGGRA